MKPSPLQLDHPTYPAISVRAVPEHGRKKKLSKGPLPVEVGASVLYDSDGTHFAYLKIEQEDESFPYVIEIQVFTSFTLDVEGCRAAYRSAFNPHVVAVNVARILYSGAREMLAFVTSRGPHGTANLPSLMIEPGDVDVEFESGKLGVILAESFGYTAEAVDSTLKQIELSKANDTADEAIQLPQKVAKKLAQKKQRSS